MSGAQGLNEKTSRKQVAKSTAQVHPLALAQQKEASGRTVASKGLAAQGNWEHRMHQQEGWKKHLCSAAKSQSLQSGSRAHMMIGIYRRWLEGERTQAALAALPKDPGSTPAPTWQLIAVCNSSPSVFFRPLWTLHTSGTHTCMQEKQPIDINNKIVEKKNVQSRALGIN